MASQFEDQVEVLDSNSNVTININANRGAIYAGDNGKQGSVRLRDESGVERVSVDAGGTITIRNDAGDDVFEIDGEGGTVEFRDPDGNVALRFVAGRGGLDVGASGTAGYVWVHDEDGAVAAKLNGDDASLQLGSPGRQGQVELADAVGSTTVELDGGTGTLKLGADGNGGALKVLNDTGGLMFHVTASLATLRGGLVVGARNAQGSIGVMGPMGRPAIVADGGNAKLQLGNIGNAGDFAILDNDAAPVLEFNGLTATLEVGGQGKPGYLVLRNREGAEVGRLSGNEAGLFLGREGQAGEILILDGAGRSSFAVDGANGIVTAGRGSNRVVIDGSDGDIKLSGADCAERFSLDDAAAIDPGTVLVIGDQAALRACATPYDKRVAGVASGAHGVKPGIILNRDEKADAGPPVALTGKVYCKVDADFGPVEVGDLLTTSPTLGHAMKADDPHKAYGAVLGKALDSLDAGTGLLPVLVSLL